MIKFKNAVKSYNGKNALDGLNVEFEQGQITALIAPNGHGKTTLMKTACGLVKLDKGECTIDNKPVSDKTNEFVTYMPTEMYFYKGMSIEEIGKYHKDFYKDFNFDQYRKLIKFMELDMKMKIHKISSGMASKLKISVALARNSKYLLLDEPLNGIDLIARDMIIESIIKSVSNETGIIISSHLFDELESITDRAVMVKEGKLAFECELEDLRMNKGYSMSDLYREMYARSTFEDVMEEIVNA